MFSELLAEGRVTDPARQRGYLGIITAETARLTRLINNVLDFARIERGEKKYNFQKCDLVKPSSERPLIHIGRISKPMDFNSIVNCRKTLLFVEGDRDALAQVVVNLLSNAEKYSDSPKEIALRIEQHSNPLPHVDVKFWIGAWACRMVAGKRSLSSFIVRMIRSAAASKAPGWG